MRVRQMVGRQAGEIVDIPYAEATALLSTGQVLLPWEASKMVGGPEFEPEEVPEHLAEPETRGVQLAGEGLPDVGAEVPVTTKEIKGSKVAERDTKGAPPKAEPEGKTEAVTTADVKGAPVDHKSAQTASRK